MSDSSLLNASRSSETQAFYAELTESLGKYRALAGTNPLSNPISLLGLEVSKKLTTEQVSLSELSAVIQSSSSAAFLRRASRLGDYLGEMSIHRNTARLEELFRGIAKSCESFESFEKTLNREWLGVVMTAHPTFGLSDNLYEALAGLALDNAEGGSELDEEDRTALQDLVASEIHAPDDPVNLSKEHALSLEAIGNLHWALRRVYGVALDIAREHYPEDWNKLSPRLMTVASWVGYDLDGRSDILWHDTFRARMKVELEQLRVYLGELTSIRTIFTSVLESNASVQSALKQIEEKLRATEYAVASDIEVLSRDCNENAAVEHLGKQLARSLDVRLTDTSLCVGLLTEAIDGVNEDDMARALCILRAEMANHGLGMAHTHVRLNSSQLHNAIRGVLKMEGSPDEPGNRRRYLNELTALFDELEPVSINVGSIMAERTSGKRLFMIVAQMMRYIDSTHPIRFLIAECDTAFTILTALYFARLFGVAEHVDISPLFETETALERADSVIEKLLDNPHYRKYVEERGRIAIQTGFSDAGRHLGQPAASMAIERLRMKMARMLSRHGLDGIELLIFDTHGESIGRGSHPVSFSDRLNYTSPPKSRKLIEDAGLLFKQELSFQGGDGYLFFKNESLAFATLARLLENTLAPEDSDAPDAFYDDTDHSLDFFITAKEFNENVMDNPSYGTLLDAFGTNLLYKTGSRVSRRQHDGGVNRSNHPSQIRAIPHNAILQQLGFLANSIGGLGAAISNDMEQFISMYENSSRCRRFMSLVSYARSLTNPDVLAAYISLFDPDHWLALAETENDPTRKRRMRRVVSLLGGGETYEGLRRIFRIFREDLMDLDAGFEAVGGRPAGISETARDELDLLHGLRVGLIQEFFLMVVRVPRFSSQSSMTIGEVMQELLRLSVLPSMKVLGDAFPTDGQPIESGTFGEQASYISDEAQGYKEVHQEILEPMVEMYELMRRVTTAVTHVVGAFG